MHPRGDREMNPGAICFPRRDATPGKISAVKVGCRTVWGFSYIDFTPGECGAVELKFRWASFPPGENGAEECDYIRPAPLAGSSVCTRTVTGSLLFGSPPQACTELSLLRGSLSSVD